MSFESFLAPTSQQGSDECPERVLRIVTIDCLGSLCGMRFSDFVVCDFGGFFQSTYCMNVHGSIGRVELRS